MVATMEETKPTMEELYSMLMSAKLQRIDMIRWVEAAEDYGNKQGVLSTLSAQAGTLDSVIMAMDGKTGYLKLMGRS